MLEAGWREGHAVAAPVDVQRRQKTLRQGDAIDDRPSTVCEALPAFAGITSY